MDVEGEEEYEEEEEDDGLEAEEEEEEVSVLLFETPTPHTNSILYILSSEMRTPQIFLVSGTPHIALHSL